MMRIASPMISSSSVATCEQTRTLELSAIHTLFVREHNQLASAIAASSHGLSDEQIFQRTRRIVVAELQVITYNEFLPALLGANALRPYSWIRSNR